MPPLPPIANVIKIVHTGTVNAEPWATVSHWRYTTISGTLDNDQLTLVCAKFVNSWRDNVRPYISHQVTDTQVEGTDLTSTTSAIGVAPDGDTGAGGGTIISPESSVLISKTVLRRYRGGHPRTYWPGVEIGNANADAGRRINDAFFPAIHDGLMAYYADVPPAVTTDAECNCATFTEVSVSYVSGGTRRLAPVADPVVAYNVHQILATQRRRMHRA